MFAEKWSEESYLKLILKEARQLDAISLIQVIGYLKSQDFKILFYSQNTFSFSPNLVEEIEINKDIKLTTLNLNFTNFFGYQAALFDFLAEKILHEKDQSFLSFLNIFYNRIFQLVFENNKINSKYFSMDLNIKMFSSIGGLSPEKDVDVLQYTSFFMNKLKSKKNFEKFLWQFTGVIARIQEFVGEFLYFDDVYKAKLDGNSSLDGGVSIGNKYWCHNSKIKIMFFPKFPENWDRFLDSKKSKNLLNIINKFLNHSLNYEILIFPNKVIQCKLSIKSNVKLGMNTFLCLNESKNTNSFFKFKPSL